MTSQILRLSLSLSVSLSLSLSAVGRRMDSSLPLSVRTYLQLSEGGFQVFRWPPPQKIF